jgi:hypothetical protein
MDNVLMSLIIDKDMVVADAPCTGATLIAKYDDGFFAFAISGDKCVFGFEGKKHVVIDIHELIDLFTTKNREMLQ